MLLDTASQHLSLTHPAFQPIVHQRGHPVSLIERIFHTLWSTFTHLFSGDVFLDTGKTYMHQRYLQWRLPQDVLPQVHEAMDLLKQAAKDHEPEAMYLLGDLYFVRHFFRLK